MKLEKPLYLDFGSNCEHNQEQLLSFKNKEISESGETLQKDRIETLQKEVSSLRKRCKALSDEAQEERRKRGEVDLKFAMLKSRFELLSK